MSAVVIKTKLIETLAGITVWHFKLMNENNGEGKTNAICH